MSWTEKSCLLNSSPGFVFLLAMSEPCSSSASELMRAIYNQNLPLVRQHIANGADVNAVCKFENAIADTPLTFALNYGTRSIVSLLIESKADLELKNCKGNTALAEHLSSYGHTNLDLLLKAKANIDVYFRNTVPIIQLGLGWIPTSVLELILRAKADVNLRNKETGETALIIAVSSCYSVDICKLLLQYDADVEMVSVRILLYS